jgi:glycosyltransferase involved in cell wall biosynthesis
MEKITSKLAHQVICISKSVKTLGINHQIFNEDKVDVIDKGSSNGVNLNLFNPELDQYKDVKNKVRSELNLEKSFVFGFLGRIVDRKGINELFQVFNEIYNKNQYARLLLVGPFEMNQIADKKLIEKIESHPGIINFGKVKQEEVPGFMLAMDVFVLPAWWEGFGNVLVQAAAMGLPVISTTGTGTVDAVSDGYNGILVPVKDKKRLKEVMIMLIEDNSLRQEFGRNGLIWAQNFNREVIWDELHRIYQS